jgi:hypothetical protein
MFQGHLLLDHGSDGADVQPEPKPQPGDPVSAPLNVIANIRQPAARCLVNQ